MKRLISCFIFASILFSSCSTITNPYIEYEKLGIEILEHPEKLENMGYFYPNNYKEEFLNNKMKDSNYLNTLIKNITLFYQNNKKNIIFHYNVAYDSKFRKMNNSEVLDGLNKQMSGKINKLHEIFEFDLTNDNYEGFAFRFIQKGDKCYLNLIYITFYP